MSIRRDFGFRLPPELYDKLMAISGTEMKAADVVNDAVRFWLAMLEESPEPLPVLTAEQEMLARRLLRYLLRTESEEAQHVMLLLTAWEKRQARERRP